MASLPEAFSKTRGSAPPPYRASHSWESPGEARVSSWFPSSRPLGERGAHAPGEGRSSQPAAASPAWSWAWRAQGRRERDGKEPVGEELPSQP